MFNLCRYKAKTKIRHILIGELLYTDDCVLAAHTEADAQVLIDCFARSTTRYGLTVSIKKTEVMLQPKPGVPYAVPTVTVRSEKANFGALILLTRQHGFE